MIDIDTAKIGFVYTFQCIGTDGRIRWELTQKNLMPNESRNYLMAAGLLGGPQFSTWYIGLYSGSYTPVVGDTMAAFPASATEITAGYSETVRQTLVPDAAGTGTYANVGSPAVFSFTAPVTVRGGFISSNSVKGGTTGVLLSAVLAGTAKSIAAGEQLKVVAGLSLATV